MKLKLNIQLAGWLKSTFFFLAAGERTFLYLSLSNSEVELNEKKRKIDSFFDTMI